MKPNKLVELDVIANPVEACMTLSATPGMDMPAVSKIIGLQSSRNQLTHLSLADLVRLRLSKRKEPVYASFDEFVKVRTSCNLIEEIQGEFYCDCRQV